MNTSNQLPFPEALAQQRAAIALEKRNQRLAQLVRLIDELSFEMGSSDFRDAVRAEGYDIDASTPMLAARGMNINN